MRIYNKSRKTKGGECRIGIGFPRFGGKRRTVKRGGGCGCGSTAPKSQSMALPSEASMGPLTASLYKGGGCGCASIPKLPTALGGGYKSRSDDYTLQSGGYRATKRNMKYLKLWKKGKSIGFTMRSSLKAKGLIPRANGTKKVSSKYRSTF
jgi:hypothetical protein